MPDIEDIIPKNDKNDNERFLNIIVCGLFTFFEQNKSNTKIKSKFLKEFHRLSKVYRIQLKKSQLVGVYRELTKNGNLRDDPMFWKLIQKKPVRNTSGVNPVTLMYSPYPNGQAFTCRFKCKYCQTHPEYPKSYGPEAPASSRGISHEFEAIGQMNSNLKRLHENGHEVDKLEMNYEGGTFSEIPRDYILEFHRDTYFAANTFFDKDIREPLSIEEEMSINETARVRIIGMTIETRPDTIDADELKFFRQLGVTRVQIGVQHTDNSILKKSDRGHTYEQAVYGTHLLKSNGFKVVHHYMTALPYATPEDDLKMLVRVYNSTKGRPHEIKIYPYSVVDYSAFRQEYEEGRFTLYSDEEPEKFRAVMKYALEKCPPDIRICRAVRDIPTTYILGGCQTPNLRQLIMEDLEKDGRECSDIRSREISRRDTYSLDDAIYYTTKLNDNDYFLSLESTDKRALFGFLRLRINSPDIVSDVVFPELINSAIIEELHVYSTLGMLVKVGERKEGASQHCGVGTKLIKMAEDITWRRGIKNIAVIAGEGVREYYKKRGFTYHLGTGRFMVKTFKYPMEYIIEQWLPSPLVLIFFILFILSLRGSINFIENIIF